MKIRASQTLLALLLCTKKKAEGKNNKKYLPTTHPAFAEKNNQFSQMSCFID